MSREITFAELQQHKSEDSLWLLIDGQVYDVTAFQSEHPGGDEVLLSEAGKDATESFEDIGHSEDARAQLKNFHIGRLIDMENVPKEKHSLGAEQKSSGGPPLVLIIAIAALGAFAAYRYYIK